MSMILSVLNGVKYSIEYYSHGHGPLDHRQTNLIVQVRLRDVMKFTRSVIPYIYCNLQWPIIDVF